MLDLGPTRDQSESKRELTDYENRKSGGAGQDPEVSEDEETGEA